MNKEHEIESKKKLVIVADKWYDVLVDFNKQSQRACYAGVAIVWVFTNPIFSSDFNSDFQKFAIDFWPLIVSLLLFGLSLLLMLAKSLFDLDRDMAYHTWLGKQIVDGHPIDILQRQPSKIALRFSYVVFFQVVIAYAIVLYYVLCNLI